MTFWKSLSQRDVLFETAERIRQLDENPQTNAGLVDLRQWLGGLAANNAPLSHAPNEEFGHIQADVLELLTRIAAAPLPSQKSRSIFNELDGRLKQLGV